MAALDSFPQLIMNDLQEEIFKKRYAFTSSETWEELAKRVSSTAASVETNGNREEYSKKFEQVIKAGLFMPGGRILFGAGRRSYNMLNCYRLHCNDTVSSIAELIKNTYLISCGGGGIGYNFSDIRPKGDDIQNIKYSAPGSVSVMKMVNEIGSHVRSGKNRRTALIAILDITHPDILEFLHVKLDLEELTNFNISVGITNKFLDAVKNNESWNFTFNGRNYYMYELTRVPKNSRKREKIQLAALNEEDAIERALAHRKKHFEDTFKDPVKVDLKAKEIWDRIMLNSWKSGEPGLYNLDLCNNYTNVSYFADLSAPNPCGEQPLEPFANCCLGHINASIMYNPKKNDVDWKLLASSIRKGIRFLDNIITANSYPIPECKDVAERSRRIGLGITGLHYLLIKLGYKYGDSKCLEFLDRFFATFRNEAYLASIELAKEKGSFPAFDAEKYLKEEFCKQLPPRIKREIGKHGIRNAVMLTVAPCGTNSMVLGVSSGIEPIFAPVYHRRYLDGKVWKEELVADKLFSEFYAEGKDTNAFIGSHDITVEEHIAVQATIQKYIDSAISKTTNLPEEYSQEQLSDIVLEYAPYVKGFTIYRTGSRGTEPLSPVRISDLSKPELDGLVANSIKDSNSIEACKSGVCEM